MKASNNTMKIIARIHTDFPTKFGVPRQSELNKELKANIGFEPEYRNPDAFRGVEDDIVKVTQVIDMRDHISS